MSDTPADQPPAAAPEPSFSMVPTRTVLYGQEVVTTAQPYAPLAPSMGRMRVVLNGEVQPYIERVAEDAPDAAPVPLTQEELGAIQKQADKEAEWRLLDRRAARSPADEAGQQADAKLNARMLKIRRTRNELGRDFLYEFELGPPPRRPFDRRRRP